MTETSLDTLKSQLLRSMRDYMAGGDVGFGEPDIVRCGEILARCIDTASTCASRDEYLKAVELAVNELNDLNADCDHGMIETMERESICELIIKAGSARDFNSEDEDITEPWREW